MALTRKTTHDDIDSLCSHLGLDPAKYFHFPDEAAPSGSTSSVHEIDLTKADEAPASPSTADSLKRSGTEKTKGAIVTAPARTAQALPMGLRTKLSTAPALSREAISTRPADGVRSNLHIVNPVNTHSLTQPPIPSPAALSSKVAPSTTRWPSLRGLNGSLTRNSGINSCPVAFHPVGGGVGLTTVLATTGKALSLSGQRVLVADDSRRSTLPFFFGAPELLNGTNSVIVSNGIPTYLLSRGTTPETDTSDEWLWSKAAQLDTNIDVLLMEARSQMAARTQTWVYATGVSIFVLEPDMRSAMALPQTLEHFAATQERFSEPIATYFLLNKYDEESPFHVDMRQWLQDELEGMLTPVVLRRDERVSEALAHGKTVLEFAPESEIAEDFRVFARWLTSVWKR